MRGPAFSVGEVHPHSHLTTMQAEHRVKEAARTEKQLDELRGRWEALKRAVPQVGRRLASAGTCSVGPVEAAASTAAHQHAASLPRLRCTVAGAGVDQGGTGS